MKLIGRKIIFDSGKEVDILGDISISHSDWYGSRDDVAKYKKYFYLDYGCDGRLWSDEEWDGGKFDKEHDDDEDGDCQETLTNQELTEIAEYYIALWQKFLEKVKKQ